MTRVNYTLESCTTRVHLSHNVDSNLLHPTFIFVFIHSVVFIGTGAEGGNHAHALCKDAAASNGLTLSFVFFDDIRNDNKISFYLNLCLQLSELSSHTNHEKKTYNYICTHPIIDLPHMNTVEKKTPKITHRY